MQGVQILVALLPSGPGAFFAHQMSQDFFQCLIEDNLMEKCILIARLTEQDKSKSSGNSGKIKAEALMKLAGLDPQKFSDRLCKHSCSPLMPFHMYIGIVKYSKCITIVIKKRDIVTPIILLVTGFI